MRAHLLVDSWPFPYCILTGPRMAKEARELSGVSFIRAAAAGAKSLQLCPTLWDPIDSSLPGSPIPGILQARRLEWVAISFFNAWKWKVKVKSLSCVRLLATPWTAARQAPPPMGFSRQEYWSGVPLALILIHCSLCWLSGEESACQTGDTGLIPGSGRSPGEGNSNPLQYCSEKAMAPHSSTLAWKIPWTEEPGRLQSMGSLRVRHDWTTSLSLFTFMHWRRKVATHSSVLAWRIPWMGEPGGLLSTGLHRVGHDWSDVAVAVAAQYSCLENCMDRWAWQETVYGVTRSWTRLSN